MSDGSWCISPALSIEYISAIRILHQRHCFCMVPKISDQFKSCIGTNNDNNNIHCLEIRKRLGVKLKNEMKRNE